MFKLDVFVFTLYFGFFFIYLSSSNNKIVTKNINTKNIYKVHTDINGIKYKFVEDKEAMMRQRGAMMRKGEAMRSQNR